MTRQYIGARYVPRIAGDWSPNTLYEPLTVVIYNGNSYTSKKDVPSNIGSPDNNPEYWACTGAYNAQVAEYQNTVNQYKLEVENLVAHGISKGIICIGDSYAGGSHGPGDDVRTDGWPAQLAEILNLNVETTQSDEPAIYVECVDGGGIYDNGTLMYDFGSGSGNFNDGLTAVHNTITNNVGTIIVCGGVNDTRANVSRSNILSAFTTFATNARSYYGDDVDIIVCYAGITDESGHDSDDTLKMISAWAEACAINGLRFFSLSPLVRFSELTTTPDKLHLTRKGYTIIANALKNILMGDSIDQLNTWINLHSTHFDIYLIGDNNIQIGSFSPIGSTATGMDTAETLSNRLVMSESISATNYDNLLVKNFSGIFELSVSCEIILNSGGVNSYHLANAKLSIDQGDIKVYITALDNGAELNGIVTRIDFTMAKGATFVLPSAAFC